MDPTLLKQKVTKFLPLTLSTSPLNAMNFMAEPTFFETAEAFRHWLQTHAAKESELLVGFYKAGTRRPSLSWSESVDEALCFGWIDGVRKRIDDQAYSIRFTRRKPTSVWSAVNIAKVEQLRAAGKMTPAGEQAFALRREHKSRIYAYETKVTAELSVEEQRAFKRDKAAWAYFEAAPPGYRHQMLHRIASAKRPETRASRLAKLVEACAAGIRLT